jgi:hypothetical protein
LLSTPDLRTPFQGCYLDGTVHAAATNTVTFVPAYQRFLIGSFDVGGMLYSTPRPNDIKATSDSIRIRNLPPVCAIYSAVSSYMLANSNLETDLSSGPEDTIGSLHLTGPLAEGQMIDMEAWFMVDETPGDTLTLRFKMDGVTVALLSLTLPAMQGQMFRVNARYAFSNFSMTAFATSSLPGVATNAYGRIGTFNRFKNHTLSLTGQWTGTASSVTLLNLSVATLYPSGA